MQTSPRPDATVTVPPRPRVVALGDSVIAGYGVGGRSYADLVAQRLEADRIMSYARSTFTVLDAVRMLDRIRAFDPDVALVNLGGSDGLVHAGEAVEKLLERFAPKSWRGVEGLEPKPQRREPGRLSHVRARVTGTIKLVVKHVGVRLTGGYRRVTPDRFEPAFAQVLQALTEHGALVVVIGVHAPDEFLWPHSTASGLEYEVATQRVLREFPQVLFVDPKPVLERWGDFLDDHAHFNERGHRKVADLVWAQLADRVRPAGSGDVTAAGTSS